MFANPWIYNRTIVVLRFNAAPTHAGAQEAYSGARKSDEQIVVGKDGGPLSGVPASIQKGRQGQKDEVGLPADATGSIWNIFAPEGAIEIGDVQIGDVLYDDEGLRYQVLAPYVDALGAALTVMNLKP